MWIWILECFWSRESFSNAMKLDEKINMDYLSLLNIYVNLYTSFNQSVFFIYTWSAIVLQDTRQTDWIVILELKFQSHIEKRAIAGVPRVTNKINRHYRVSTYIEHRNPKRSEITVGFNPRSNANKQIGNKVARDGVWGGGNRTFRLSHKACPASFKARGIGERRARMRGDKGGDEGNGGTKKIKWRELSVVWNRFLLGRTHNYGGYQSFQHPTSPSPIVPVGFSGTSSQLCTRLHLI